MNYLTEIKLFYEWLEMHPLTPSAIALWHGLMFMANRSGWTDEFAVPLSVLESRTGIPTATLYRTRVQLTDSGLISVNSPGGSACARYRILSFEQRFVSRRETQNESPMGRKSEDGDFVQHFASRNEKQNASINKTKLNSDSKKKKKKEKSFSLEEWVSGIESPWREIMRIWLEYKKARKEGYNSEMGAKACLTKLRNLSRDNPDTAQAIVEQSMANNWAGLFPLSSSQGARGPSRSPLTPATGQRIGQIMQPETEDRRNAILAKFKRKAAEDVSQRPTNPDESTAK